MVQHDNRHIWAGLGFIVAALIIGGAIYIGLKPTHDADAAQQDDDIEQAAASGSANMPQVSTSDVSLSVATVGLDDGEQESMANQFQQLSFNAIGPYVNKEAGYVCEGERWVLFGADDDANGHHLIWQDGNGQSREFSYQWNGKIIQLTDVKSGDQLSLPLVKLESGEWLVKGERLEECAG